MSIIPWHYWLIAYELYEGLASILPVSMYNNYESRFLYFFVSINQIQASLAEGCAVIMMTGDIIGPVLQCKEITGAHGFSERLDAATWIDGYHVWTDGSIYNGNPFRWTYAGDSLQMADLHGMHQIKRQNRGDNGWGYIQQRSPDFGQLGCPTPTFEGTGSTSLNPTSSRVRLAEIDKYVGCFGVRFANHRHDFGNDKSYLDAIWTSSLLGNVFADVHTERRASLKRKSPMEHWVWVSDFRGLHACLEMESSGRFAGIRRRFLPSNFAMVPILQEGQLVPNMQFHRLQQELVVFHHLRPFYRIRNNRASLPSQEPPLTRLLANRQMTESSSYLCDSNIRWYMINIPEGASLVHAHGGPVAAGMVAGTPLNGVLNLPCMSQRQPVLEPVRGSFSGSQNLFINIRDYSSLASRLEGNQLSCPLLSLASSRRCESSLFPRTMPGRSRVAAYGAIHSSLLSLHRPPVAFPLFRAGEVPSGHNVIRAPFGSLHVFSAEEGIHHQFASHEFSDRPFYNRLDINDQHSDMRLDVDNMTYEDLLALEERIGTVNTGLADDAITKCLRILKYSFGKGDKALHAQGSDIKCSICQEEYVEDDEIGLLKCGHTYHTLCIKQWLVLKNQCPICKALAHSDS